MVGKLVGRLGAIALVALLPVASAHATDVAVVRVGDGSAALTANATAVFIDVRDGATGSMQSAPIALPTAASGPNSPLTLSGSGTSEGGLTRSADGRYLVIAGYAAVPGSSSVAGTAASTTQRVVGRIARIGTVDTTTLLGTAAYSAASIRSAASNDGAEFWTAGNGDVWYSVLGGGATDILTSPSNSRRVGIFGSQLYITSGSSPFTGVSTVGSGLPTTAGQAATLLSGFPTSGASPYDFVALDMSQAVAGIDTIYVADDRAIVSGGGVQKWTFDGATWTLAKTFANGLSAGVRGLAGDAESDGVHLWATTAESPMRLVSLLDDGVTADPAFSQLAVAATNTAFRGVALAPALPTVSLSASSYATAEGAGKVTISVHRAGPVSDPLDVSYATADGSAQAGSDYTATSGTLHFAGGQADAGFDVPIVDDSAAEDSETFTVSLTNPSTAALASPSSAAVTIADNDAPPSSGTSGGGGAGSGPVLTSDSNPLLPGPSSTPPSGVVPTFVTLGRPRVKRKVASTGLGVRCPTGTERCAVSAQAKSKALLVASGKLGVAPGSTGAVKLTLTPRGAAKLKRAHRLAVRISIVVRYAGGTYRKTVSQAWI